MRDRKPQEAINLDAISTLAQEMHQPFEVVKEIYDHEFARLQSDARIPDFLVLFASRRTRDALNNRRA